MFTAGSERESDQCVSDLYLVVLCIGVIMLI